MTWTHFHDMHSGGTEKTDYGHIYIKGDKTKAVSKFRDKFQRSPFIVTCQCCGPDYSVTPSDSLKEATKFQRTGYGKNESLGEYKEKDDVLIIGDLEQ